MRPADGSADLLGEGVGLFAEGIDPGRRSSRLESEPVRPFTHPCQLGPQLLDPGERDRRPLRCCPGVGQIHVRLPERRRRHGGDRDAAGDPEQLGHPAVPILGVDGRLLEGSGRCVLQRGGAIDVLPADRLRPGAVGRGRSRMVERAAHRARTVVGELRGQRDRDAVQVPLAQVLVQLPCVEVLGPSTGLGLIGGRGLGRGGGEQISGVGHRPEAGETIADRRFGRG